MKFLIILLMGVIFSGCSRNANKNEVIGTYRLNTSDEINVIKLYSSGAYQHEYKNKEGQNVVVNDSWTFEILEGRSKVVLHNFKTNIPDVNNATGNGYFVLTVTSLGDTCRLWIDSYDIGGHNIYFKQISKSEP